MYKFSPTDEISEDDSVKPDQNCTAVDKNTGELCGETESLKIFNEFQKLYEDRVARVDHELKGEFERACMKLQIMGEWIRDLGEQNIMLVHTVEDLEHTACSRVKLLEEKLQQSSTIVSANMRRSNHTEEEINKLSKRVSELEHDIGGLLELIRRARQEHHWNMDGITFNIVQPCNIPAPINCSCDQEETNNEKVHALKLQVEQQQENERKLIEHQAKLKKELADLTAKLVTKENTIKNYVAQIHNLSNSVKRHSKLTDEAFHSSLIASDAQENPNIVLMADIVENVLVEKDLEVRELKRRLQDAESELVIGLNGKNLELDDLTVQLSEKNKETQEIKRQMCCLQEEFVQARKCLTAEVTEKHGMVISLRNELCALQEQYRSANMEIDFKEGIIKKMRKMLKQAPIKETHILQNVYVDTNVFQEDIEMANSCTNHQDQIIPYLIKTKLLMESEKEMLSNCKLQLEEVIEKLQENEGYDNGITSIYKKLHDIEILLNNYKTQVIDYPECEEDLKNCLSVIESQVNCLPKIFQNKFVEHHRNKNELSIDDIKRRLNTNVECIAKMYIDKEETTAMINSIVKRINNDCACKKIINTDSNSIVTDHFKVIEAFKEYASEAQATKEDMKIEIGIIVSTSKSEHQRYNELSKKATTIQDQLRQVREEIIETVTKLQLQEEERTRHNERITSGKIKLKDIKNEMNHAQTQLASRITDMQEGMQEQAMSNYTQICICNNLLGLVTEEIDNISSNLLVFQTQGCSTTSILRELQKHLYCVESSLKELQKKTDEVALEQDAGELTFYERGRRLEKLETDLDMIHMKMQDALQASLSVNEQVSNNNIMKSHIQEVHDIFRTEQDFYKLKKECDDWKHKALQKSPYAECDEKQWKCRVADLQDQVKTLEHEAKCNQETNDFLRNSIESMEKELRSTQTKADNYRRTHSIESMEYMKKIIELENAIKTQKETECTLRQHLDDSEMELKKSKELFNSLHTEYGADRMLLNSGCNQLRYETMNINQVFKTLQGAMQSTKSGLQDFKVELKKLIYEDSSSSCSSTKSVMSLIDQLQKYEQKLDYCSEEIEKLRNTLYKKDKLLENRDEIIRIQKDSIVMTQAQIKELHQKLQEKIDAQNQIICQYEKEKGELLKQNELQIQTIGHLQKAVVEAKRCIDQMEQKAMSDVSETWPPISPSTCNHGNVHDV